MEGVVGVFRSRSNAVQAIRDLLRLGQPEDNIVFLTPGASPSQVAEVPTTNAEAPGMGKAIGSMVGGAMGGGMGLGLGAGLASLLVPGVGAILVAGLGAGALLGASGAVAGAVVGEKTEEALDTGIPIDDVARLRDLLKAGRTLVVVSVDSMERGDQVQALFNTYGAEPFHHVWGIDRAA